MRQRADTDFNMRSLSPASTQARSVPAELVIKPAGRWGSLRLVELWEYRELLYFFTKRELQVRYKQSYIGVGWALLQPLALTFVFAIVFGRLARIGSGGLPYPVFALAALAPWIFFAQSAAQGATSVVDDAPLVSKVYFPRVVIPIAKVLSFALDLTIAMAVVIAFAALYGVALHATGILVPLFLILAIVVALGAAILLAGVNVPYRDIGVVVPVLITLGMFATPVVYPASLVPDAWQYVYAANPMVSVVEGVRWSLFHTSALEPGQIAVSVVVALLLLTAAYLYFKRIDRVLADII